MGKKGQQAAVGGFILMFIGVIVALSLLGSGGISDGVTTVTQTVTNYNQTFTAGAVGANVTLNGQAASSLVYTNATNTTQTVDAGNFTVTNYVSTSGVPRAILQTNANSVFAGRSVNITYVYEPVGYARDSGTRSIAGLITIFAALAVVAFVLVYVYKYTDMFR